MVAGFRGGPDGWGAAQPNGGTNDEHEANDDERERRPRRVATAPSRGVEPCRWARRGQTLRPRRDGRSRRCGRRRDRPCSRRPSRRSGGTSSPIGRRSRRAPRRLAYGPALAALHASAMVGHPKLAEALRGPLALARVRRWAEQGATPASERELFAVAAARAAAQGRTRVPRADRGATARGRSVRTARRDVGRRGGPHAPARHARREVAGARRGRGAARRA